MNFRRFRAFLLVLLGFTPVAMADETGPVLTARPGLCILQQAGETRCVMAVELEWRSDVSASYCLYHSVADVPLRCWDTSTQGQHHSELSSPEDVSYWLQQRDSNEHLAEITIRVLSLAQRNPDRRRRRHVWSLL